MVSKSEVYTGEAICPPVKVVRKDKITNRTHTLKERIDYKVEYRNNINAGEAEIIVTGINRYRGGVKIPFTVAPAPLESISVIPTEQYNEIDKEGAYTTSIPKWIFYVLFFAWGWLMWRLWVWIETRGKK